MENTDTKHKGRMAVFFKNKFPEEINQKIESYLRLNIYKLFYKFNHSSNPNREFKCIFEDFIKFSYERDLYKDNFNKRFLNVKLKSVKYFYNLELKHKNIDLTSFDTTTWKLERLITHIKFKKNLNNFYISENKETLYIIEDECLDMFNIKNKEILSILDKLPYISHNTGDITLQNNILNPNSEITNINTNIFNGKNKLQIFIFNDDLSIDFNVKNKNTYFTLDGNIKDWYYIHCSYKNNSYYVDIIQLIYITQENSKKFNEYFKKYKISFKIDLQRIYKILYEFKDVNNTNLGFKCIYKYIFETSKQNKIISLLTNKISKIYYCYDETFYKIFIYNPQISFKDNIMDIVKKYNVFDEFDYNKLFISEDETILYYIENDSLYKFNILNKSFLDVLDDMPNIEYSEELFKINKSYYYTIILNNNLFNLKKYLLFISRKDEYDIYKCTYNIQLFKFENNKIIKTQINANTTFNLEGDIRNWYYILTTLKSPAIIKDSDYYLDLQPVIDTNQQILQLVYITPEIIEKYNILFLKLKIPFNFIRIQLKSLPIIKKRVYKIFYDFTENNNPNKGLKCIYKKLFDNIVYEKINIKSHSLSVVSYNSSSYISYHLSLNIKLTLLKNNKIKKIIYCSKYKNEIIIDVLLSTDFNNHIEKLIDVLSNNNINLRKNFNYNKLYISMDETTLYYIENNYINNFIFVNSNVIDILNNIPYIEYSQEISTKNNSYYYIIKLNNDLKSQEIINNLFYIPNNISGNYICNYEIQIFKFENEKIIKTKIKANNYFNLDGNLSNWYFILFIFKTKKIFQLIYITTDMIEIYKKIFDDLKMPIDFEIKNKINPSLLPLYPSPNYPSIKVSTETLGGDYKSTRLLKSY